MQPYEQGALDNLCGLYALVNACKVVAELDRSQCEAVFDDLVSHLEQEQKLAQFITTGTTLPDLMKLVSHSLNGHLRNRQRPFRDTLPTLDEFWEGCVSFLQENERSCILLGLDGEHYHWTLVTGATSKQLRLYDSGGLKVLNRSKCTVGDPTKIRLHALCPSVSYFLS